MPNNDIWLFIRKIFKSRGVQGILVILILGLGFTWWLEYTGNVYILRQKVGIFALAAIIIPIQVVLTVSPVPLDTEAAAFASSIVLGAKYSILTNWIAWVIAAIIEYRLVRQTAEDLESSSKISERMPKWLKHFPAHHPVFLICGLWIPFGSHLVSSMAGAHRVPIKRFILCVSIGYIPYSLMISGIAGSIFGF